MNRSDFQKLSAIRLREARSLLVGGHYDGAYYLAGYAVECALKACIARQTRQHDFPDKARANASWSHDLEHLAGVAGLSEAMAQEKQADPNFRDGWDVVKSWNERARYQRWGKQEAEELVRAVSRRNGGVLPWLKHFW